MPIEPTSGRVSVPIHSSRKSENWIADVEQNLLNFINKENEAVKSLTMESMEANSTPEIFFGQQFLDNQPSSIDQCSPIEDEKLLPTVIEQEELAIAEKIELESPIAKEEHLETKIIESKEAVEEEEVHNEQITNQENGHRATFIDTSIEPKTTFITELVEEDCFPEKGEKPGTIVIDTKETLATEGAEHENGTEREDRPGTIFMNSRESLPMEPVEQECILNKDEEADLVVIESKEDLAPIQVEDECMRIIKDKLNEYKQYYPESRIFREDLKRLTALKLENGYYIGECESKSQRSGYGNFFLSQAFVV